MSRMESDVLPFGSSCQNDRISSSDRTRSLLLAATIPGNLFGKGLKSMNPLSLALTIDKYARQFRRTHLLKANPEYHKTTVQLSLKNMQGEVIWAEENSIAPKTRRSGSGGKGRRGQRATGATLTFDPVFLAEQNQYVVQLNLKRPSQMQAEHATTVKLTVRRNVVELNYMVLNALFVLLGASAAFLVISKISRRKRKHY